MNLLKTKLQKVILQLQSNQVLQMMKNDESLVQHKRQHIRQLIREELQLESMVEALSSENAALSAKTAEFVEELQNIQVKWEQCRLKNEKQKKDLQTKYSRDIEQLRTECNEIREDYQTTKTQLSKLKRENDHLKTEKSRLDSDNALSQQTIIKLKKELELKGKDVGELTKKLQEKSILLGSQNQSERIQYEQIIAKMQEDMHLIRESWQRKCQQIQTQLKEQNNLIALEYEQRMRRQLKEHAESLKLGNSVIITDSEEIIAKRVEKVQQQFLEQMKAIQTEMQQLSKVYQSAKQELETKEKIMNQLKNQLRQHLFDSSKAEKQLQLLKQSQSFEIERIKVEKSKFETQNKTFKEEVHSLINQNKELKELHTAAIKKTHTLELEFQKIQHQSQMLSKKIQSCSLNSEEQSSMITSQRQEITKKDQQLAQKQTQIQFFKNKFGVLEETMKTQKKEIHTLTSFNKKQKDRLKKQTEIIQKLQVNIRKIKRQLEMMKEEVKSCIDLLKRKCVTENAQLCEFFQQIKDQNERKYKAKMGELLDEMEIKEKEQIQAWNQEKEQLKYEISEKEELIKRKDDEKNQIIAKLANSQQQRRLLAEDLDKQKIVSSVLQQKIETNEDTYFTTISKMQKEVSRSLSSFHAKWSQQLDQVQRQLDEKDAQVKLCIQKLEELSSEGEEQKRRKEWAEEQTRKYKRKYDELKSERDEEVKNHLKRLEQETKHRINLEKELKEMRFSIVRGTAATNNNFNNFSFNDKETNYNTNLKQYVSKDTTNEREKELSQIREMIAKTYKVVGDTPMAERDIVRGASKRNLF